MASLRTIGRRRTSVLRRIKAIWNPSWFQDGRRSQGYFEGWYLKCVDAAGDHPVAVIPGIALDPDGEQSHALVQLIRSGGRTTYWEFPLDQFRFAPSGFEIEIGPNRFTSRGMDLDLTGESGVLKGHLEFGTWKAWTITLLSPGAMGWYRFVPFMETYHGVLGFDHAVSGLLEIDGEELVFDGGRGYAEKDWGRSFPSSWIWAQSNNFTMNGSEQVGTSVMISVARIPWMGGSFVGFVVGFLHEDRLHRFTTFNGARMVRLSVHDGSANLAFERGGSRLEVTITGMSPGKLRSPVMGTMDGTVWEGLDARIVVELRENDELVFSGTGRTAGVELMDDADELGAGVHHTRGS